MWALKCLRFLYCLPQTARSLCYAAFSQHHLLSAQGPPSGWPPVSHILPSGTAPVPATELGAFFGAEASRHPEKNAAAANAGPG